MKVLHTPTASKAFDEAPAAVQKAFLKQVGFLKDNLMHPGLHAKKYSAAEDNGKPASTRTGGSTSKSKETPSSFKTSFRMPNNRRV